MTFFRGLAERVHSKGFTKLPQAFNKCLLKFAPVFGKNLFHRVNLRFRAGPGSRI